MSKTTALLTGLVLASLMTMGFAPAAVSADDTDCDALFNTSDCEMNMFGTATSYASGALDRATASIDVPLIGGDDDVYTAEESAQDFKAVFNNHSTDFVSAYNDRVSSSDTGDEWVRLTFEDDNEDRETVFLHAEFDEQNEGELLNAEIKDNIEDGEVASEYIVVDGLAQEHAGDELEDFHADYIEPDEAVDYDYMGEMSGKYFSDLDKSFDLGDVDANDVVPGDIL